MHVWLPILLIEAFVVWLVGRAPKGDEVADEAIGRSIATLAFVVIFVIVDVVLAIVRNW